MHWTQFEINVVPKGSLRAVEGYQVKRMFEGFQTYENVSL